MLLVILGNVAGPSKSEFSEAEESRQAFKRSMTGDEKMEDTVKKIRQKVKEVRTWLG